MQKKSKKQAKHPFGVMKERKKRGRRKEDEKQEIEFAEGFRRINKVSGKRNG